jgi:hypothetical protein
LNVFDVPCSLAFIFDALPTKSSIALSTPYVSAFCAAPAAYLPASAKSDFNAFPKPPSFATLSDSSAITYLKAFPQEYPYSYASFSNASLRVLAFVFSISVASFISCFFFFSFSF